MYTFPTIMHISINKEVHYCPHSENAYRNTEVQIFMWFFLSIACQFAIINS